MKKKSMLYILAILLVLFGTSTVNAAITVGIDIGPDGNLDTLYTLDTGDAFTADIVGYDLKDVMAMGFKLQYDPSQLNLQQADVAAEWSFKPETDEGVGQIEFNAGAPLGGDPISGNVALATVTFQCLNPGTSIIKLGHADNQGGGFFPEPDEINWMDLQIIQKNPNPVPIPGAVWLLGAGLIGLAGFARKKRQ